MSVGKPSFVLVHGAWSNSATWVSLVPALDRRGHEAVVVDLPGAGLNATNPASYTVRPLDAAAFAIEPSPNAGVTQDERTEAVIAAVEAAAALGNGKVVLVGHSLGGLTISPVAETIPDQLASVVYLAALLLAPGMMAGDLLGSEAMADSELAPLFMADPEVTGAFRLDTASTDPEYLAKVRSAFYGDLTDDQFASAVDGMTHCDEPAQVAAVASAVTAERFGSVDRHYIRCVDDRAIVVAGQDYMIASADAALGSTTTVHHMATSHSPFHSDPDGLADILASITGCM